MRDDPPEMFREVPENWSTLAGRLEWAAYQLEGPGARRGARELQRRLQARSDERVKAGQKGIRGVHLSSVNSYIRGKASPKPEWLRVAADILDVNLDWLVSGRGSPTRLAAEFFDMDADLAVWQVGQAEAAEDRRRAFEESLAEPFPMYWDIPSPMRHRILGECDAIVSVINPGSVRDSGRRFGEFLAQAFTMLLHVPDSSLQFAMLIDALIQPFLLSSQLMAYNHMIQYQDDEVTEDA